MQQGMCDQIDRNQQEEGAGPARPGWDRFRLPVREACVRNDSRNVAARAVPGQSFGTVAKLHVVSARAATGPELAQEILASGVLKGELCSCRWVKCISRVGAHHGNVLAIRALKPYDRLCMDGRARDRVIAHGKSLVLNSEVEGARDFYERHVPPG